MFRKNFTFFKQMAYPLSRHLKKITYYENLGNAIRVYFDEVLPQNFKSTYIKQVIRHIFKQYSKIVVICMVFHEMLLLNGRRKMYVIGVFSFDRIIRFI